MKSGERAVKRVLILDDDPVVLRSLIDYLRSPALHLTTCSEIEAAECLLDSRRFDVLISDLEVSSLGGLEGIRLIRHARVHFPELQVVVFSGKINDEIRRLGHRLGVQELLEKPADMARLRELLDSEGKHRGRRGSDGNGLGEVAQVGTLDEVLAARQVSAVLQPIVGVGSGAQVGDDYYVEGLARGPKDSALRSPELLLGYASRKERLVEVELLCIAAVLAEARYLSRARKLFINMRPRSMSTPGFAAALEDLVARHGYRHEDVVLELTEQQSILNTRAFGATLSSLRDRGFGLALDDYGTGFANLHLIEPLQLDFLKIDGYFCRGIEESARKQAIVEATVSMADRLGIATIVEHVETEAELETVRQLGASYAQGYYFSEPVPGSELEVSFQPRIQTSESREASEIREPGAGIEAPDLDEVEHEISNLLTAIALFATQSLKKLGPGEPLRGDLEEIRMASERAIALRTERHEAGEA